MEKNNTHSIARWRHNNDVITDKSCVCVQN